MEELSDVFKSMSIIVDESIFAILKGKIMYHNAFAMVKRSNSDITLVVREDDLVAIPDREIDEIEKDWKLITFDGVLPFEMVGFIAKISTALANANISIFVLSSYSTDHILVKEDNLVNTLTILTDMGFKYGGELVQN